MSWLRRHTDGSVTLTLYAQPGTKRTAFVGLHGDALKLRLGAAPIDGKANACLTSFLADYFKVGKSAVTLISGETSRHKIVSVAQPDSEMLRQLLELIS